MVLLSLVLVIRNSIQREARKLERRQYWTARSTLEAVTIIGIVWYLKMELLRTKQVPPNITQHTIQYCNDLVEDVKKVAALVYNDIYRDRKSSEIVLLDTGRDDLEGRRGIIQQYDSSTSTYDILVAPRRSSGNKGGAVISTYSECMEPLHRTALSAYNSTPKVHSQMTVIPNSFNCIPVKDFSVCFRHGVLHEVQKQYSNPELDVESAYTIMDARLSLIDKEEQEEKNQAKLRQERQQQAMEDFLTTHTPTDGRPYKRQRFYASMPTWNRSCQTNAQWEAKLDYIKHITMAGSEDPHMHLFTYPFKTSDDSFVDCIVESPFWRDSSMIDPNNKDKLFYQTNGNEPVIITTSSVQSLTPGLDLEENVIDLCFKWYVLYVHFFLIQKSAPQHS